MTETLNKRVARILDDAWIGEPTTRMGEQHALIEELFLVSKSLLATLETISGQLHNIEHGDDIESIKRLAIGAREMARDEKAKTPLTST